MIMHTLNSIKENKGIYNKIKTSLEKRLYLLIKFKELQERNLKITAQQILNNKQILKSKLPIELILKTKNKVK